MRSLWTLLSVPNLDGAKIALAQREGIETKNLGKDIGIWVAQQDTAREQPSIDPNIEKWARTIGLDADEKVGVQIVRRAIEEPMRQLANNAGAEGALIVEEVKKRKGNEGYDVAKGEYVDLVKAGIVDPTKVTRSALQNAASIAGLLLTTEALVTEVPEKEKAPAMPPGGMGGMDY